ncbi:MAG: hypothetical protein ACI3V3_02235 [Faecousia sp.]
MFLRNFYRTVGATIGSSSKNVNIGTSGNTLATYTLNFERFVSPNDSCEYPSLKKVRTSYNSYGGVIFGNGNADANLDDYSLSGDIVPVSTYSVSINHVVENDKSTISAVYTITNTGDESITIKEIALKMGYTNNSQYLIERTVLDNPVTIEPGGVGQVTYTITFTYPTA